MAINKQYRKELHFDNIHRFFNAIRKSDMELDISITARGVDYQLNNNKPFNQENWNRTLSALLAYEEITEEEVKIFNVMIETLLGYYA